MGTYIFSPTFLMDAHFGFAKQVTNSEQPGLGTNKYAPFRFACRPEATLMTLVPVV